MLQHPQERQSERPITPRRAPSIQATAASVWCWSKMQAAPRPLYWCSLFIGILLIEVALYLPLMLSFTLYAFRDSGSGLEANDLVRRGMLPAVDFGYYHGLLPLMLGRLWFSVWGTTPHAYAALRVVLFILSSIVSFYLFQAVRAPRMAYVMFCLAMPFIFFYRPSINHDLASLGIVLSLLLLVHERYGGAVAAALASVFCHPSLGYVMLLLVALVAVWLSLRSSPAALLRTVYRLIVAGIITVAIYAAACLAFFRSATPLLRTLFPSVGKNMRSHYGFSLLRGGLTFIHPPGSNWKYLVGSNAGPYLLFNLILAAVALVVLVQLLQRRSHQQHTILIVFFCCIAIHAIYLIFVFSVPDTWSYDAYLLVVGLAALPLARTRHLSALIMTGALLIGSYGALSASRRTYPLQRRAGLWIDARLDAELAAILQQHPQGKPYVWSMAGALSMIDGRFQSPARWFVVPGTNPPAELARLKQELLANSVVFLQAPAADFLQGPGGSDHFVEDADFDDVALHFRQVDQIDDFTVCARRR